MKQMFKTYEAFENAKYDSEQDVEQAYISTKQHLKKQLRTYKLRTATITSALLLAGATSGYFGIQKLNSYKNIEDTNKTIFNQLYNQEVTVHRYNDSLEQLQSAVRDLDTQTQNIEEQFTTKLRTTPLMQDMYSLIKTYKEYVASGEQKLDSIQQNTVVQDRDEKKGTSDFLFILTGIAILGGYTYFSNSKRPSRVAKTIFTSLEFTREIKKSQSRNK